jgi:hypothetical protein
MATPPTLSEIGGLVQRRPLSPDELERYQERCAIAESDGGLTREEARRLAAAEAALPPHPTPGDRAAWDEWWEKWRAVCAAIPDELLVGGLAREEWPGDHVLDHHGVPDDRAALLPELLDEAKRLQALGRPPAEVHRAVLALNRNLPRPLPSFSPGGLCDCVNACMADRRPR